VTLHVSGVSQGYKDARIRSTDEDADADLRVTATHDSSTACDIDWSGAINSTDRAIIHDHMKHWHRNALHGTLVQRTSFNGSSTRRGDSRPFWSPSARYLSISAHTSSGDSPCYIFIVASNPNDGGNALRQVTSASAEDYDPSWSPLNNTLIYGRGDSSG
jgi:hypothetical protein